LAVALIVFMLSLNGLVRAAMEKVGTAVLGAQVTVKSVGVSMARGSADIRELVIANPQGYGDGNLLELGGIKVALKAGSLLSDTVEVSEVIVDAPTLKLRQQGLDSNLQAVLKNAGGEEEKRPGEKKAAGKGKKFKVGLIRVTRGQLEYALGAAPAVRVPLPDIELKDISNADGSPVMLKDIFVQVLSQMAKSAAGALKGIVPEDVTKALDGAADAGAKAVKKTVEGAKDAIKGVGPLIKNLGKKDEKE